MKSRARSQSPQQSISQSSAPLATAVQPYGNAAAAEFMPESGALDEGLGLLGEVDGALGQVSGALDEAGAAAASPLSTGARMLGLDGLKGEGSSLSYAGGGQIADRIDVTLGMLGPLTVGLGGAFNAALDYQLVGAVEEGWFGGRSATLDGSAHMDLDTSIAAKVALDLLVAEAGLRGGLDLLGRLDGTVSGSVELDELGLPASLTSFAVHLEGAVELGAAAELYVETVLTDAQTMELGQLPLGLVSGFALDLAFDDSGLTSFGGALGGDFAMSPELEAVLADLKANVGL